MTSGEGGASDVRLDIVTWEALYDVAHRKGRPVAALIKEIASEGKNKSG